MKASETVDTLRECYMLELEQKSESTTTSTPALVAAVASEAHGVEGHKAKAPTKVLEIGGSAVKKVPVAKVPVVSSAADKGRHVALNMSSFRGVNGSAFVNGTKGAAYTGFLSRFVG